MRSTIGIGVIAFNSSMQMCGVTAGTTPIVAPAALSRPEEPGEVGGEPLPVAGGGVQRRARNRRVVHHQTHRPLAVVVRGGELP